ncbi:MAG: hypothetical protein ACTHNU_15370 [Gaiellales bacterium]
MLALVLAILPVIAVSASAGVARGDTYTESLCQERPFLCIDPYHSIGDNGSYTGHDEPSVMFRSHRPGTGGADLTYTLRIPKDPPTPPKQNGKGGTWNFQQRSTFWLGLTMCDSQSDPNFTHVCKANSDYNAKFKSTDPKSQFYIGKHPGNAYMELQFYAPGWVPQFAGYGCSRTQWCANMTIASFSDNANTGAVNNSDCLDNHFLVGLEPVNWAYVTKSGKSQAPANPLFLSDDPTFRGLNPNYKKDLLMNGGDLIRVHLHDTPAGERADITDLTTHAHGSMTASKANGFGQILFQPNASTCHVRPYAFHPEYNSAVARGNTWSAHTYNVAFSDEIGHFEYCNAVDSSTGACTSPGANDSALDGDDFGCLDGSQFGARFPIIGCTLDDGDFDGPSYQFDWPGTFKNAALDQKLHARPVQFTVPTTGDKKLESVLFENDMARIERGEPGNPTTQCDALTGANCVNPPPGARFYPIYTTTRQGGHCWLQQGGTHIPGTIRTFGGSSATEYGTHVLFVTYPAAGWTTTRRAEDFQKAVSGNLCPS